MRVSAAGGPPEALTKVDQERELYHGWPDILPGGKAALFSIGQRADQGMSQLGQPGSIAVVSLETGEQRILIRDGARPRYVPTGHLVYAQGGTLLAAPFDLEERELTGPPAVVLEGIAGGAMGVARFSVSDSGSLVYISGGKGPMLGALVWVDRTGQEEPVALEPGLYKYSRPQLSSDGRHVTIRIHGPGNEDVWIYDLARATSTRLTFDAASDTHPVWMPDGRRVVFRSTRDRGSDGLFWKAADGTGPVERLTTSPNFQAPFSFSPDGKSLVFIEQSSKTGSDIHVLSMEAQRTSRPLLETPFDEGHPVISPDGRWMAYESNEPGRREVCVRPFPNTEEGMWQISTDGGRRPVWGPRGHELFYRTAKAIMVVSIETEPTFTHGRPEVLFAAYYFPHYDISPDDGRFLMTKPFVDKEDTSAATQFIVVENWFEELKRLVPSD